MCPELWVHIIFGGSSTVKRSACAKELMLHTDPKGGPGMREMLAVTAALAGQGLDKQVAPEPKVKTGYLARYAKLVSSADKGAILQ